MSGIRVLSATLVAACLVASAPAALSAQVGPSDVALAKTAFQSSDYDPSHQAGKAVDGITNGNFFSNFISTTSNDFQSWWYVDLGASYDISSINLWNRTDCCGFRLADFYVSILASGTPNVSAFNAPTVWQTFNAGFIGTSALYTPPPGTIGQFVKVQLTSPQEYLQIAEVDVEGTLATTTTPEPTSLALLATGLGGVLVRRRQRRA